MSNQKVLIVEDTLTQAKTLQHLLKPGGYETAVVRDPQLAAQEATAFMPDAVLCDIMMPQMSGYQLCEQFKSQPLLSGIPFILLSGLSDTRELKNIIASGADGFIWKNFDPKFFLPTFQSIFARALQPDDLVDKIPATVDRARLINMLIATYEAGMYQQASKSNPATVA